MDPNDLPVAGTNPNPVDASADTTLLAEMLAWASTNWFEMLIGTLLIGTIGAVYSYASSKPKADGTVLVPVRAVTDRFMTWKSLDEYKKKNNVGIAGVIFWVVMLGGMVFCAIGVFVINVGNFAVLMPNSDAGGKIRAISILGIMKLSDVPYIVATLSGAYVALDIAFATIVRQCQDICDDNREDSSAYKTANFFFWAVVTCMVAMVVAETGMAFYRGMFVEGGSNGLVSGLVMMVVAPAFVMGSMACSYFVKWRLADGLYLVGAILDTIFTIFVGLPSLLMAVPLTPLLTWSNGEKEDN